MTRRTVAIELKIADNTAFTALQALRRIGVPVAGVRRREIWRLEDDGPPESLVARVKADQTIYNPNKHRIVELLHEFPRAGEAWIERRAGARRAIPGVREARHAVGWLLEDASGSPAGRDLVRAAVESLLCNPAIERALYEGKTQGE